MDFSSVGVDPSSSEAKLNCSTDWMSLPFDSELEQEVDVSAFGEEELSQIQTKMAAIVATKAYTVVEETARSVIDATVARFIEKE